MLHLRPVQTLREFMPDSCKYIFVTGGVTSSLGKGIISASLAKLLQARGFSVTIQKFDPYINVDPGTLNPYEHGECYVTDDGAETDLDLGHYERFLNVPTSQANNYTTGRIYQTVIERERRGDFLGKTVQVVPHITDEIQNSVRSLGKTGKYDFIITEIGGTVGDIESLPYIEAVRQLKFDLGRRVLVIHLTLVPYLKASGELKTKPTQHSVKELQSEGVQPDIIVARSSYELGDDIRRKIAIFCNVTKNAVIQSIDADTIYDVPLLMKEEQLDEVVLEKMGLENAPAPKLDKWISFLNKIKYPKAKINVGLIGKYVELKDSYKSILEAMIHAGAANETKVRVEMLHSEKITTSSVSDLLGDLDGIIVAPGFGERGIEGKLLAVQYARENKVPFFGICLGMQCSVIEFGRNVMHLSGANSGEFDKKSPHKVIYLMEQQKKVKNKGGTMRLGSYECEVKAGTLARKIYKTQHITERHRHRYEFNNDYLENYEKQGMTASGINPQTGLVEIVEIKDHPWFLGTQFHPEYKSTVENPHPLFVSFIAAALKRHQRTNG
jgi:CTP synthase